MAACLDDQVRRNDVGGLGLGKFVGGHPSIANRAKETVLFLEWGNVTLHGIAIGGPNKTLRDAIPITALVNVHCMLTCGVSPGCSLM